MEAFYVHVPLPIVFPPFQSKETVVKLKSFAEHVSSYTHFLQKILPYQLKRSATCVRVRQNSGFVGARTDDHFVFSFSLEEECEAPLCTAALTAKNQELQKDMEKVTSIFEKLQSYIAVLALPSECAPAQRAPNTAELLGYVNTLSTSLHSGVCQDALPQSSTSAVFTQLAACLHNLHDAIKGKCSFEARADQTKCQS